MFELQVQVFYSVLDQSYHGHHPLSGSTTEILAQVQAQYFKIPYVPNTVSIIDAIMVCSSKVIGISSISESFMVGIILFN